MRSARSGFSSPSPFLQSQNSSLWTARLMPWGPMIVLATETAEDQKHFSMLPQSSAANIIKSSQDFGIVSLPPLTRCSGNTQPIKSVSSLRLNHHDLDVRRQQSKQSQEHEQALKAEGGSVCRLQLHAAQTCQHDDAVWWSSCPETQHLSGFTERILSVGGYGGC